MLAIFISIITSFYSCDKYLEDSPSKSSNIEVKTVDHLDAILASYGEFYSEFNNPAIYSSDDYELPIELYNARRSHFYMDGIMWYLWDVDSRILNNYDNLLSGEYKKIFYANMVLSMLDRVSGSAEKKEQLKAEAHFVRAYSNFVLANTYCLPYSSANMQELGLPLKTETSYEQSIKRSTLKETYDFIEADLAEALKQNNNDVKQFWRGNIYAVKAFMARFLMFKGDYVNAQKYSD